MNKKADDDTSETDDRLYKAPALEKGLDILELVARQRSAITMADIVRQLERSTGELFRMIQVLEYRGFLERAPGTEGYRLTDKLFALSMNQPAVKGLIEVALPHMRRLSEDIGQSCHLVMHSQGQMGGGRAHGIQRGNWILRTGWIPPPARRHAIRRGSVRFPR